MRIRTQLLLNNGILLMLTVAITAFMYVRAQELVETNGWVSHTHQVMDHGRRLMKEMVDMETGQRGFMLTGEEEFLEPYESGRKGFARTMSSTLELVQDNPAQVQRLNEISRIAETWVDTAGKRGIELRHQVDAGLAPTQSLTFALQGLGPDGSQMPASHQSGKEVMDEIRVLVDDFIKTEVTLLERRRQRSEAAVQASQDVALYGLLVACALGMALGFLILRRLQSQLGAEPDELRAVAERVAEGDLSQLATQRRAKDESSVAGQVNRIIRIFQAAIAKTDQVGRGDLDVDVRPVSDKDEVARALNRMIERLRKTTAENERQQWLTEVQGALNEQLRGVLDPLALSKIFIGHCARVTGAAHGSLFIREPEPLNEEGSERSNTKRAHIFAAGYALETSELVSQRVLPGEGPLGQVVADQEPAFVDAQDGGSTFTTSLGTQLAPFTALIPLIWRDDAKGVMELRSFQPFSPDQRALLALLAEAAAVALETSASRERTSRLLERTREQAKLLQAETLSVEKQRAELEVQKLKLQESNKYKTEFLSNMSHELRTPLNSLLILSKSLLKNSEKNLQSEQLDSLDVIRQSGEELLALINDILDLSKVEAGKLDVVIEDIELDDCLNQLRRQFLPLFHKKELSFEVHVETPDLTIRGDWMRTNQILKNLIANALKFTEKGSVQLRVKGPSRNQQLEFLVEDTGIGIPPTRKQAIFEAFQQADGSTTRTHGGTGLGLSISRELAALLDGALRLVKSDKNGSTFSLVLPYVPGMPKSHGINRQSLRAPATPSLLAPSAQLEGIRVLLVDDDPRNLFSLGRVLKEQGARVESATNGQMALDKLRSQDDFDLVLMDLMMPEVDGWQATELIQGDENLKQTPIIHLTASATGELSEKSKLSGARGCLSKPIDPQALVRASAAAVCRD